MRKKLIIMICTLILIIISGIISYIYLNQKEWIYNEYSVGHFSKDTYLDGGTGEIEVDSTFRIRYFCTITSGDIILEVTDENGEQLLNKVITETCEGEVEINITYPQNCYLHTYTQNPDSDVNLVLEIAKQKTNLEQLKIKIDIMTGGRIFGGSL